MCGRYTLRTPIPEIAEIFEVERWDDIEFPPRFNIAPTDPVVAVRRARDGARELVALRWGLIPRWTENPRELPLMINARAESLARKPAFREALADRRCLVIADGFYEWRTEAGLKQPYHVRLQDGGLFAFAGLWDWWRERDKEGAEPVESCAIVTTDASPLLEPLHDRMPVILDSGAADRWLDASRHAYEELAPDLVPFVSAPLDAVPVSREVNKVANDEAGLLEPIGEAIAATEGWTERPGPESPPAEPEQLGLL